jgi:hypothetical protein
LEPNDKVRIHQEIFQLVYYSGGAFTHDEVYSMPSYLRYFNLKLLAEQKEKENKQLSVGEDAVESSSQHSKIVRKHY